MPIVLIGNKLDLVDNNIKKREIERSVAEKFVETNGLTAYYETSAKDNTSVNILFVAIANKAFEHRMSRKTSDPKIKPKNTGNNKKPNFCRIL